MRKITKKDITTVILAGGKSLRMDGIDKGLMVFREKPMIRYISDIANKKTKRVFVSANRNQKLYSKYGEVITDKLDNFQGPLAGISTAFDFCLTKYLLVLPCDAPFIDTSFIDKLINAMNQSIIDIAVAYDGEKIHATFALINTDISNSLDNFLSSGGRKMASWYIKNKLCKVDFSDNLKPLTNINTKQDLSIP